MIEREPSHECQLVETKDVGWMVKDNLDDGRLACITTMNEINGC